MLYDFGEIRFFGRGNKSAHVPFILDSEEMEKILGRPPELGPRRGLPTDTARRGRRGAIAVAGLDWHFERWDGARLKEPSPTSIERLPGGAEPHDKGPW